MTTKQVGPVLMAVLVCGAPATTRAADLLPTHVLAPDRRAPDERRPLVLFLHGLGGSGADAIAEPAIANLARGARMFVVAPDGDRDGEGRRFWNAGAACCNFDRAPVDDVTRLTALVDHWRKRPEIDPRRIYMVGFSNGGFMAHLLGCRIGDRLAAIVSIAGAGVDGDPKQTCTSASPLAVVEIHGDADPVVPYGGGRVFGSAQLGPHPSAPQTIRAWRDRLRCAGRPLLKERRGSRIAVEATRGCPLGSAELWTVRDGGHALMSPDILEQVATFLTSQVKPAAGPPSAAHGPSIKGRKGKGKARSGAGSLWFLRSAGNAVPNQRGKVVVFTFRNDDGDTVSTQIGQLLEARGLEIVTGVRPVDGVEHYRDVATQLDLVGFVDGDVRGGKAKIKVNVRLRSGFTGRPLSKATFTESRANLPRTLSETFWKKLGPAVARACDDAGKPRKLSRNTLRINAGTPIETVPASR